MPARQSMRRGAQRKHGLLLQIFGAIVLIGLGTSIPFLIRPELLPSIGSHDSAPNDLRHHHGHTHKPALGHVHTAPAATLPPPSGAIDNDPHEGQAVVPHVAGQGNAPAEGADPKWHHLVQSKLQETLTSRSVEKDKVGKDISLERMLLDKLDRRIVTFQRGVQGESCYFSCRRLGLMCASWWFLQMNECSTLLHIFPEAEQCSNFFYGRDLPAFRPIDKTVLVNSKANAWYPSCGIGHELTVRPCACEPPTSESKEETYHTVFNCQANQYFEWQSRYSYFWFKQVQQPGKWTRLLSAEGPDHLVNELPTHVSPGWDMSKDPYLPYNKPLALDNWLKSTNVQEDNIILIDPDCAYITKAEYPVKEGYPIANAGYYNFPDDDPESVETEICRRYCPWCKFFDPIAVPVIIHRKDAEKLAPLWLNVTIQIRNDRFSWPSNYTDNTKTVNSLSWVAEMYGYVIAAAMLGLRHEIWDLQGVPGVHKKTPAPFLHYHVGLEYGNFTWHKGNPDAATNFPKVVDPKPANTDPLKELMLEKLDQALTTLGPSKFDWGELGYRGLEK